MQKYGVIYASTGESLYIYKDSKGYPRMRPFATWVPGQPTLSVYRCIMWLTWGESSRDAVACHMACDMHQCISPYHGRFGSRADNSQEQVLLSEWRDLWRQLSIAQQQRIWLDKCHPSYYLMLYQGIRNPFLLQ